MHIERRVPRPRHVLLAIVTALLALAFTVVHPMAASAAVPVAADDSYITSAGSTLYVPPPGILANDSDIDGHALTAIALTTPANGVFTFNPDGSFTYVPAIGYVGPASFTYQATDGTDVSNVATVSITVTPSIVNTPPFANGDFYNTAGVPLTIAAPGVMGNDVDPDGDPFTASLITTTSDGALTFAPDGSFTYIPDAGFTGVDTFTYQLNDGITTSIIASVGILVTASGSNTAPRAGDDVYATLLGAPLIVGAPGVLANDTDLDADPLTAAAFTTPANGTLAFNPDGSFSYTPDAGYTGTDFFFYQALDGTAPSNSARVSIVVSAPGANTRPVAIGDAYATPVGTPLTVGAPGILGNDTDVDSDPLTVAFVSTTDDGVLVLNPDGSLTYTPDAGFTGVDSFLYRAHDGTTWGNFAAVTITVGPLNAAPVAVDDAYTTPFGVALTVPAPGILGNDTDADLDALTAAAVTSPADGTLVLGADGSLTYTPDAGYSGTDSFTYLADDGTTTSSTATVTITVSPAAPNSLPVGTADSYSTPAGTSLAVPAPGVLANDADADADPLTAVAVDAPAHGLLLLGADGSFSYGPDAGYSGADSFTYRADDGSAVGNLVTVTITVLPAAAPPPAAPAATPGQIALTGSDRATSSLPLALGLLALGVLALARALARASRSRDRAV